MAPGATGRRSGMAAAIMRPIACTRHVTRRRPFLKPEPRAWSFGWCRGRQTADIEHVMRRFEVVGIDTPLREQSLRTGEDLQAPAYMVSTVSETLTSSVDRLGTGH
jgi:hypothetical protein